MKLGQRERILALVAAVLIAFVAGRTIWAIVSTPFRIRQTARATLINSIWAKERQLQDIQKAKEQLKEWAARSLPADPAVARRLYQNWLLECAQNARLEAIQVDSGEVRREKNLFYRMPFTVRGQGTLESLTRFLYAFYSRDYLHAIQRLSITPVKEGKRIDLLISIEAIALDDAVAKDSLPSGPLVERKLPDLKEYVKTIVDRNVFVAYTPPPPPPPPSPPRPTRPVRPPTPPPEPVLDPSQFAYVNGIVEVNGKREVWLYIRTENKTLRLGENDTFEVGEVRGRVLKIGVREVNLEINGHVRTLALGDNLAAALARDRG
ncbi:hypothetical protein THTE_3161 [Thermogutta terrifontis]|uniref:Uncharacterized protein n=1 Tax=Thermogutta terrifontis TaxID=1331910 RepID=A0A286RIH8_9BACT|nr:hypothetical protein [Thermogutta terrifontis]ASV75763.1 hypothetical protein THTE_3161 [Thermogutta terrifontis]